MNTTLLQNAAERHLPATLDLLRRLVGINSFTANAAGVDAVARLTAEAFEPLGFCAEYVPCTHPESGHHLFLTHRGQGGDPIVLVTHSDTVFPPEEEQRNEFHWDERPDEGRIYGPGTVDNKGGTALIWLMLQILRDCAPDIFDRTHWIVAANAAEEVTGDDFGRATIKLCHGKARAVLVFEGGPVDALGWHIVTSRKGRSTWKLTSEGKAAHAGSKHHEGVNAIDALARVLPDIAALTSAANERTVNIGHIHGGTVVNRVPHEALAEWECRANAPAALQQADDFFATLSGRAPNGAKLVAERTGFTSPWPGGVESEALFHLWHDAAVTMGLTAISVPRGGLSDANHLWQLAPTLDGLGPFGANAHCSERSADGSKLPEYVEPASFVPKAVMNALALLKVLSPAS
ncbi:MAG: M20/M25/M40 family metallo-hydrolase [Prosthecobacter sp.]|jgi:glutamate carboxypeptidase|uniref:M20/M25/M40 family metallo-hydrolase n=1 Tax=Prosthecobacter sp. TaxID=1965333 RepID=UPI0019DCD62C|nr:M20/M25/M40 family metallo-hydrolase [Prosthecobacter sp.]MBE2283063.1 M20/M25/M40 family metallo-hydrolase [Prosthecobacter sp.]